jgi:hypothetical protein
LWFVAGIMSGGLLLVAYLIWAWRVLLREPDPGDSP